ncbi:type VI secretion system lipoprotein TssJ [Budvicia aquatica]|uniref:type VI secretion system lipoprotein TssJ n=1 Tax=Budvicia aquatica TaxID=82979 RepID=UPI00208B8C16|nr:type VI secretion system lipoprotein TssJ [Budvicia aquatica]GKX52687.1 type VI secretion system-associated lipoprotein [Budvicia aquatica]
MRKDHFFFPLLFIITVLLTGCETTQKIYDVIKDPNIPVGYPSGKPSEVTLTFLSDEDINPNQSGEPTPIEVQVIYLNEDSKFMAMDYDQLLNDGPEKTLGKNYVNHQDYSLLPGQFKPIPAVKLEPETRFIAVVAHFSDIDGSQWSDITEVESVGKNETVMIHIRANEVEVKKEDK